MKKRFGVLGLALLLAVLLTGCGRTKLRMGTAAEGGVYYSFGEELAQIVQENDTGLIIEPKTTAGSAANLRLISQGYLDLAIAQTDMIHTAYYGEETATIGRYQGYSAVAGLYTEACQIVVAADSDIYDVGDLIYKTVSVGEEESGTWDNAIDILWAYGLDATLVDEINMDYAAAAENLKSGKIDAMFCTVGIPAQVISDLAGEMPVRLLSVDEKQREVLAYSYGFYVPYTIPAGTYEGQTEDVETVGVRTALIASDQTSADAVQTITSLLFENQGRIEEALGITLGLDKGDPLAGVTIPAHEGALKYYEGMAE